jgi:hypothetical protein
MQVHGPSEITDRIKVTHNPAGGFAALEIGTVSIFVYTAEEASKLATAVAEVERLLGGAPAPVPLASLRGRGRYDAASPAEVAGDLAPPAPYSLPAIEHVLADLCPAQWGVAPETMLCSLASGHHGNHATAEGIEWAGQWETAEPSSAPAGMAEFAEPGHEPDCDCRGWDEPVTDAGGHVYDEPTVIERDEPGTKDGA